MKNIAIIFAGGAGLRMNSKTLPKQFLELHGKPILVYTLEHFQRHPGIDGIILVSLADWIDYCNELIDRYRLTKVSAVVPGGATGQESIYHGLLAAAERYPEDSVVLIHDGVRPLIDADTISACIDCAHANGSAITVTNATETVMLRGVGNEAGELFDRSLCQFARAPQCFVLKEILAAHEKARAEGGSFIDSAYLMRHYGHSLFTVDGPVENIKITTPGDFYIFRAIADAREDSQIFGL